MIPRRIIVTYISRSTLRPLLAHCVRRMEELHPGWEVMFFSDRDCEDFVRRQGAGHADLYHWYRRPVQRADFFRMLAVHALGGFYLDADVLLSRPLDDLCSHAAVFPWEQDMAQHEFDRRFPAHTRRGEKRMMVGQYAFAAKKGHPFIAAILEEMLARTGSFEADRCSDAAVLHSTGPDLVTTCYYRDRARWKDLTLLHGEADAEAGEEPLTGGAAWNRFGCYGRHLLNGGWLGEK